MGRAMLILAGGMVIILGMVQVSLLNREKVTLERSVGSYTADQARNIANSAADLAIAEVNSNYSWYKSHKKIDGLEILGGEAEVDITQPKQFQLMITATGSFQGQAKTIKVLIERDPFSKYSYFTDTESQQNGRPIWFVTHDTLTGPVHSNGTMYMRGRPVFNGKVTSPHMWKGPSGWRGRSANPQFNKEKNFDADEVEFPVDVPNLVQMSIDDGLRYNEPIKVEFYDDGTVGVSKKGTSSGGGSGRGDHGGHNDWGDFWDNWWGHNENGGSGNNSDHWWENDDGWGNNNGNGQNNGNEYGNGNGNGGNNDNNDGWADPVIHDIDEFNGVISSSDKVEVEGNVNGNVTVHSEDEVKIVGDIYYADNPKDSNGSDDLLGLISDGNVVVAEGAESDHGRKDVVIQASIMAMGESFTVENYRQRNRGQIFLYGGIIQKRRGPVGLVSGTGYTKSYTYDKRLLDMKTPGFPRKNQYSTVYWKE